MEREKDGLPKKATSLFPRVFEIMEMTFITSDLQLYATQIKVQVKCNSCYKEKFSLAGDPFAKHNISEVPLSQNLKGLRCYSPLRRFNQSLQVFHNIKAI